MTPPMTDPVALGRTAFYATLNELGRLWLDELTQQADDATDREIVATLGDATDVLTIQARPKPWGGPGPEPAGAERAYRLLARVLKGDQPDAPGVLRLNVGAVPPVVIAEVPVPRAEQPAEPPAPPAGPPPATRARRTAPYYEKRHPLTCANCGRPFLGHQAQVNRAGDGKPVMCGGKCRGEWSFWRGQSRAQRGEAGKLPTMAEMLAEEEVEAAAV